MKITVRRGPTWDREGPRAKASLERFGSPDEVAALIVYTSSTLASATTGAALRVDGGVVKNAF